MITEKQSIVSAYGDIIETVSPHTIKKCEIIERYVDNWARKILGFKQSEGLIFIECFSNCGVYKDENGEIIEGTPIRVARVLNKVIENYPGKIVTIYFNDISIQKIELLKLLLKENQIDKVEILCSISDANLFLKNYKANNTGNRNTLLFYDPYTAEIDWDALSPFFKNWGEIIINHMIHDTIRGVPQVKKEAKRNKYEKTYKASIEELNNILKHKGSKSEINNLVLKIIDEQAKGARKYSKDIYKASFPFYTRTNGLLYTLNFYSSHIKGLILFKQSVWKTFGNKSSSKKSNQIEGQMEMFGLTKDEETCYSIRDIATFVYETFHNDNSVSLKEIYTVLEKHPIFPCEPYKNEIKRYLKEIYKVKIKGDTVCF